ncbi:subclass B3 metallo-beta-lactamase [Limnoglobus roseus]|uniref:Subclass B3 metallo-beta-lactamase n=1 Tax=Limnoglobus roseus TaxID=2598579 RepID=A0A5C1ADD0_9BACT|nr:subclass B3 metallo-beta-lactamase [Limnoglobus roseus]QEL16223.1 subclass B3 metallo-beta-lactamase [Limnoglobus roseus]
MTLKLSPLAVGCAVGGLLLLTTQAMSQAKKEDAGKGSDFFLQAARKLLKWDEAAEPFRIVGPVYFVGTKGLGSYLITGSEGHVVLNTGMPGSGPMIEKSIRTLGFKPEDVKLILAGHAHVDHVGGHAHLKKVTGAKVAVIREEKELFESGGKLDFQYGGSQDFQFDPTEVGTVFRDGDEIKVGDVSIRAILTPGHTKGSTTYFTNVVHDGKTYTIVFPDGTSVNPGYRVTQNPSYKGIGDDFRRTFRALGSLKPDVWLTAHNDACGLDAKRGRTTTDGVKAWVDPDGYRKWVAAQREAFETLAGKE